uniref:Uncharacterized protein n=1 Tax=Zea mays TaxID=4577 RepID=A0A804PZV5_MAIZE
MAAAAPVSCTLVAPAPAMVPSGRPSPTSQCQPYSYGRALPLLRQVGDPISLPLPWRFPPGSLPARTPLPMAVVAPKPGVLLSSPSPSPSHPHLLDGRRPHPMVPWTPAPFCCSTWTGSVPSPHLKSATTSR